MSEQGDEGSPWNTRVERFDAASEYVAAWYQLRAAIEGRPVARDPASGTFIIGPIDERPRRHPPGPELAAFLREMAEAAPVIGRTGDVNDNEAWIGVPRRVLLYLAGRLDDSIKLPANRPPEPDAAEQLVARDIYLLWRVRRRQGAYRRVRARRPRADHRKPDEMRKTGDGWRVVRPLDRALRRVAAREAMSHQTLRNRMKAATRYRAILDIAREPVAPVRGTTSATASLEDLLQMFARNEGLSIPAEVRALVVRSLRELGPE